MKKALKYGVVLVVLVALGIGMNVLYTLWRHDTFVAPTYDETPPVLAEGGESPRVLIFSKTNSFRHVDAIPAANSMFTDFGKTQGWSLSLTENAAVHNAEQLATFDLLIWNNVSGDVLSEEQRTDFKTYVEEGGKVLAIHGSGGSPVYDWAWHPKEFIRAQFIGHPLLPQFQDAALEIEESEHPAMRHLPKRWDFHDEWYTFRASPREDVHVLATLDESSYTPSLAGPFGDLRMGDHPIIWYHNVGKGTVFYSALGHKAAAYSDEDYRTLLQQASLWLLSDPAPRE